MINFNTLAFERLIIHHILEKQSHQDSASANYENELFRIPPRVEETIKTRLINAAGKYSKAFELEIENTSEGSFFEIARTLREKDDIGFVKASQLIADLLALAQTKNSIPGGKLIIIDARDRESNNAFVIVIKAELHEALQQQKTSLELLDNIFLSPSQKLFKIGVLYEVNKDVNVDNGYGAFIFDDQFRTSSQPAEYFYGSFLGFSIANNGKLQSKRFYDKTHEFIKSQIDAPHRAIDLIKALKIEFTLSTEQTITPRDFGTRYFEGNILDSYLSEVVAELPGTFVKDDGLLASVLNNRHLAFPNNIRVMGPENEFEKSVKIVNSSSELSVLEFNDSNYSILKISGKPLLK